MDEVRALGEQAGARLRVAVLSLHTSPTAVLGSSANGGMNVYVREVSAALSERGIATDIFTRRLRLSDGPEWVAPLSRVIYLPAGPAQLDKYALREMAVPFADAVARFSRREGGGYDLVYSHYWLSGLAGLRLSGGLEVPWMHTAHTLGLVKNRQLARGARPEPEARVDAERAIARSADLLIASTEREAEDLIDGHGAERGRVVVIPPGVDLARFGPLSKRQALRRLGYGGSRLLLFVGRLERLKGVEVALRAFAMAAGTRHPDVRFLVLGEDSREADESEKDRLRKLARDLGIADRVTFVGSVPHGQLPYYYAAAEACLMPSYSESFGLVGLEAQACGCPVVASNVAGLASVVRDEVTGYLVVGDDATRYADRLGRLLEDPELADQMGRRGILLAQKFPWSRTADRLQGQIEALCSAAQDRVQVTARQE
ncbi:MAG: glycosyltransferase [Candidatus Dormibacteraceae bacterium]